MRVPFQALLKRAKKSFLILALWLPLFASADGYVLVSSVKDMERIFARADEDTLVIFDIDLTITTPSDPCLQLHTIKKHQRIYDSVTAPLTKEELCVFNHLWCVGSVSRLVEEEYPAIIEKLQRRKVRVIGFTAAKTGAIGTHLPDFPEWRFQDIKRFGIDFSDIFPDKVLYKEIPDYGGSCAGFEKGIVYSGQKSAKGDVLRPVLKTLGWMPKKVIAIDDKSSNLESLEKAFKEISPGIEFIGIHYRGVDKLSKTNVSEAAFRKRYSAIARHAKKLCR